MRDEIDDRAHAELIALYQMAIDDIERAKQWAQTTAYYTVVAQGGIVALLSTIEAASRGRFVLGLCVGLMLAITAVSHFLLRQSLQSLAAFRSRAERCRPYFRPSSAEILGPLGAKHNWPFRCLVWTTGLVFAVLLFLQG